MQIPSFLQKFGRDIVYLCVISGLVGWIWVGGRRQELYNQLLFRDLKNNAQIIERYTYILMDEIRENTTDYESEKENFAENMLLRQENRSVPWRIRC
ncbi:MAG: hypothetical protein IPH31_05865 [Lewinellaceae bacterium]|nr:hypothetical protein [Lewinellaceae bacterium]